MILFVFEGEEREPGLFRTLERLFFKKQDYIICSFGNNIYELYQQMHSYGDDGEFVDVLKEYLAKKGDKTLSGIRSSQISEVFLFFDYDFQNSHLSLDEMNKRLESMLELFDEETGNGKLYINYPMVESIRYTKELPDDKYVNYVVTRTECRNFKRLANEFCVYENLDYIILKQSEKPSKERYSFVKDNWKCLVDMNVKKANFLVSGHNVLPVEKSTIGQRFIFDAQLEKFVGENECVAVLNSFPLFLFEYLKVI